MCASAGTATAEPDPDAEPTADELERVFQHRPRADLAPVVLMLDGVEVATDGPLLVEPAGDSPTAPSAPIVAALARRLDAATLARLRAASQDDRVSIAALRALGLEATFDPHRLELRIAVPPRLTATMAHDLGAGAPAEAAGAIAPSDASGFLNLYAGGGGRRAGHDGTTTALPLHLNSDAAVNLVGWVLEARGDVATGMPDDAPATVHRGDVVVTRDIARLAVRTLAGDLAVPAAGLQASYPVLGLAVTRNFALQPYRIVRPIGSFDFLLERPSTVTVVVNGAPVQTLRLPAGRHDLRDLPLGAGVSDVVLRIKDDAGIERQVAFSTASPDALLAPGVVQFSLATGFPLRSDVGLRSYDDRPIVSGRLRAGVISMLTLGGSFDGDHDRQLAGGGLAVATRLGNLSLDVAASRDRDAGTGAGVTARYDYSRSSSTRTHTFSIIGHHQAPGFRQLGPEMFGPSYSDGVVIAASSGLSKHMIGRLDVRYQLGPELPDAHYVALGVTRAFGSLGLDASVSALRELHTPEDIRLFVTAHWTLPERSAVHASSRTSSATGVSNEVTVTRRSGAPVGGLASSVRLRESPSELGADGALDYTGYRFTTSIAATDQVDRVGDGDFQTASFEAATALAFAGGRVAWSRPIVGSFALIDRDPALDGVAIGVNPAGGGYAAQVGALGPAVVPNLEAYRVNRISVDAPALPLGASLGPESYTLMPTYRSGTRLHVGEPGTVFLRGVLMHFNGEALALAVAELRWIGDRKRAPIVIMTNRVGRFSAMGLEPGSYGIRLAGETATSGELEIPAGTTGVYSAGIISVK